MEQYNGISEGDINISDILDVIQTTDPGSMATIAMDSKHVQPHVEILEQPASKALRFRYECEGRSAGSIPGVNSTPENKTFPSIRIMGYQGRAMVVVSCVTKDAPYRPHPHNLVGKEVCKQGVCTVEVPSGNMVVTFSNLGIQCVKKKDIEDALRVRQDLRVDPFRTGFEHKRHPTNIDLNSVRLCFQVFLEGSQKGKFNKPLPPIVSDPIYDKKAMSDLVICKLSHCSASVAGSMDMILLCEKVAKEDIQVRFFEMKDGQLLWEGYGDFQPTHVHKQTAISFRTPSYRTQQVEQPVEAYIQLKRPSDGATSEPLPFQMLPLVVDDADSLKRKRQKLNNNSSSILFKHVAEAEKRVGKQPISLNIVKAEPTERISPFGGPGTSAGGFNLQSVRSSSQPHSSMQSLRPQVSPGRTPSPMEYSTYNQSLMHQQYLPNIPIMQQPNITTNVQPFTYQVPLPDHLQLHQPESNLLVLKTVTPNQGRSQPLNNIEAAGAAVLLDMDNQQFNFDWNSAELADFGANLSANLSTGLSLCDPVQPEANNNEENNINENISWINQELSNLNKILKTNQEDGG
ncbi:PREDICTED: embryonic polarity protein dorsal isoform X3 [Vollenhovia emeryi]|uniref:embryonic polarity protein dorsal isoform X3 n=1 Tax=Vollenhovia emeryi TaxID=411798 RepID=UPI0005F43798|nr:PREDICTED: embryonic polarity protein dorsal isoform X3 [Vollenhovia emeryi]